jgi:hypothetical protein
MAYAQLASTDSLAYWGPGLVPPVGEKMQPEVSKISDLRSST